jgi:hypothetical protein
MKAFMELKPKGEGVPAKKIFFLYRVRAFSNMVED